MDRSMLISLLLKARRLFIRSLLKVADRKAYKIRSEYWPWIRILPSSSKRHEVFSFSKKISESTPISDIICDSNIFVIIGSGPSIKDIDFSKLKNANIILLNGAISLIEKKNIHPFYCVIIDSTFIENRFDIVCKLPEGTKLLTTPGCLRAIYERDVNLIKKLIITVTQNVANPIYHSCTSERRFTIQEQGYSDDLDIGYIDGGTVMAVGIQLSFQLHAKKIYLLGLDISNTHQPRFYEKNGATQKSGLAKDYESKILPFMKQISIRCKVENISIFNCSKTSRLPYDIIPFFDMNI